MKCPKCGTYNGRTNKFCRECGLHLAWVAEDDRQIADAAHDDIALGEMLADVYDCYESGDLDVALSGAEKIVHESPNSTSAHGILALIYERKGEIELEANNPESARDFLELALSQYEKIVNLNPGSAADKEKLAVLRMKLKGKKARVSIMRRPVAKLKAAAKSIPPQAFAAGAAFVVVSILAIMLLPGGNRTSVPVRSKQKAGGRLQAKAIPNGTVNISGSANTSVSSGLKIYTFPAPAQSSVAATSVSGSTQHQAASAPAQPSEVKPVKLPLFGNELTIVPESKKTSAKVEPVQPKTTKSAVSEPKEDSTPRVDGTSLLATAIQLRNQGRTQDAINTAQQAITHFQAEVGSGSNVTSAKRGIDNANKLIALWQQSIAEQ